jgi:hypothetical protein
MWKFPTTNAMKLAVEEAPAVQFAPRYGFNVTDQANVAETTLLAVGVQQLTAGVPRAGPTMKYSEV